MPRTNRNTKPISGSYRLKLKKGYIMEIEKANQRIVLYAPRKELLRYNLEKPIRPKDIKNIKEAIEKEYNL